MTEQSFIRDIIKLPAILARTMDNNDGKKDDQISGSVWNEYIAENIQGAEIDAKESISFSYAKNVLIKFINNISEEAYKKLLNAFHIGSIDSEGNVIMYDYNGQISMKEKYDDNGNRIVRAFYDDNNRIEEQWQYDEDDNVTMIASYKEGKLDRATEYNLEGQPSRNTQYNKDGTISHFDIYSHDSRGNLSQVRRKNAKGITITYAILNNNGNLLNFATYDPNDGNLITSTCFDDNEKPQCVTGYNEDGSVDYKTQHNPDGSYNTTYYNNDGSVTHTVDADKDGNITRTYYTDGGRKIYKTEVYDSKTELWTITNYNNKGSITSVETAPMCFDGIVGDSAQRGQSDCYLLASINAIRQSAKGQEYLNSLITKDGDNVVITLPGAKIAANNMLKEGIPENKMYITGVYTFTPAEMKEIKSKEGTGYSLGDDDTILLEAAFEKYRKEVKKTMDENNIKENDNQAGKTKVCKENNPLWGGSGWDAVFILTGQKSEVYINSSAGHDGKDFTSFYNFTYENNPAQNDVNNPNFKGDSNAVSAQGALTADDIDIINNNGQEVTEFSENRRTLKRILKKIKKDRANNTNKYIATCSFYGHTLSIKTVTDDYVTLINPHHPDKTTKMSIDEFMEKVQKVTLTEMPAKTT